MGQKQDWINQAAAVDRKDKERNYWLQTLADFEERVSFPYDAIGGTFSEQNEPATHAFCWDGSLRDTLLRISNNSDARLHMILVAAVSALLARYSGQDDIVVGTPIYTQNGNSKFVNTMLALRHRLDSDVTFRGLLGLARKTLHEAVEHQNYPLAMLPNQLEVEEEGEGFPLFDVTVMLSNVQPKAYRDGFDASIHFVFTRNGDKIDGELEFDPQRYRLDTVERMLEHLRNLILWAAGNADEPLASADILSPDEIDFQLRRFNQSQTTEPRLRPVHYLFEEQVDRTPQHVALQCLGDGTEKKLSYLELDRDANRLSHYLIQHGGVKRDVPVGLLLDNSPHLVTAILAVLKAGGGYVPLDPNFPESRLRRIVKESGLATVISEKKYIRLLNRLQWECGGLKTYLCLDTSDVSAELEAEENSLMDKDLWEHVNDQADDDIDAGGWVSSYTGDPFSPQEMTEYSDNIWNKLQPLLKPSTRVLEIGCASGLSMYRIAPHVALYYGTDLAEGAIRRNRRKVEIDGFQNIKLASVPAHDIDSLDEAGFDLIILNSVIQCFHGHNYLRDVIGKAVSLLNDNGHIFVGDVMDQDLKLDLIRDMEEFNRGENRNNRRAKTDWSSELFVSRSFFKDLPHEMSWIAAVECTGKEFTIENELTKFRYDVLLTVDRSGADNIGFDRLEKSRYQHDLSALEPLPDSRPDVKVTPDFMAYTLFTSGSTGTPKGVVVEHGGLSNYLQWAASRYLNGGGHVFALHTSISFDLTVTSLFTPLISGNTVGIYSYQRKGLALEHIIDDGDADVVKLTPSHLKMLRHKVLDGSNGAVSCFVVGGEQLDAELAADIQRKFGEKATIFNEYGPTEAIVGCMIHPFDLHGDTGAAVPIGIPINNVSVYILDKNMALVPRGVAGELYVAGAGLARGYLNAPELTANHFIPNPFAPGGLMYRTGDLARFSTEGIIEFIGRRDHQVKIRGHRIELDEVRHKIVTYREVPERNMSFGSSALELAEQARCGKCLLPDNFPEIDMDGDGVCNVCREYESYKDRADSYFQSLDKFLDLVETSRAGTYDCLLLYSGGKDSTYVLYRLVELGLKVLAFTFDNGFISDAALKNVRNVTSTLNVDSVIDTTPNMNRIFVESLRLHQDVCNGCFKAVNALGVKVAREHGINVIVTGVSRGQIFDIKLHGLYRLGIFDHEEIERKQFLFRKNYFSPDDSITRLLGADITEEDLKNLHFVDFFRYEDVSVEEIMSFLGRKDSYWNLPRDTGLCSTNCRINDVGIYVHLMEKHFHNYAPQLSWDCRLGLMDRDEGLKEISFDSDPRDIEEKLTEIGYFDPVSIKEAVVLDQKDDEGDSRLAAYVVSDGEIDTDRLREYVRRELPDYMVPDYIVPIDRIPLNANGKLDRNALPAGRGLAGADYRAPEGPLETALAEIWSEILGIPQHSISADADFFGLGGHSLKATLVVAHIHKKLEVKVPLADVFNHSTIRALAHIIGAQNRERFIHIPVAAVQDYYEASPAQKRLYIMQRMAQHGTHYNMPMVLKFQGAADEDRLLAAMNLLIQRHEGLRTSFHVRDDRVVQHISASGEFQFEHYTLDSPEQLKEIIARFIRPFDLAKSPLVRGGLVETRNSGYYLLIDIHHIVSDGITAGILEEDFTALYNGEELPPLRLQYKDFSQWQHKELQQGVLKLQEDFWLAQFKDGVMTQQLPLDFARPNERDFTGNAALYPLDEELSRRLGAMASERQVTLYMMLLALFNVLMYWICQQDEIIVGTAVGGRRHADLDRIVGIFANMLVLRNLPRGEKRFVDFLIEVKERCVSAFEHQDYPFDRLVEEVVTSRDPSRNPIFDVVFEFNSFSGDSPLSSDASSMTARRQEIGAGTSMFDLLFDVTDSGGRLFFKVEYCTALFKRETIDLIVDCYFQIIRQVVNRPTLKIEEIVLPDAAGRFLNSSFCDENEGASDLAIDFDIR